MNRSQMCPVANEKILLATDGLNLSKGAVKEAIRFSKLCFSKLYAMSVVPSTTEIEAPNQLKLEEKMLADAKKHLDEVKALAHKEGVDCEVFIAYGDPHQRVIEEAKERKIDIIFTGRGKGLRKLLMGEVAAKVVCHVDCKVIVVPQAAVIGPKNLLIATDGSGNSIAAAEEGVNIAKRCGSSIITLSSARNKDELKRAKANVEKVIEMAKREGVSAEGITPLGRSYNLIVETAGGRGVDLIVIGIPVKTAFQKFFSGSATEKIIGHAACAVLIVKGKELPASV